VTDLGVVDVLFGPVAAQPITRHLKLLGTVAKGHEAQHPEKNPNRFRRHHLHRANVDGLRIVAQPVAKVDALHVHLAELLPSPAGNEQREQRVLDVSMAPVLALDSAQACNVTCTESGSGAGPEDDEDQAGQPKRAELELGRHCARCVCYFFF
jgi:hypothetical protein